MSSNSPTNREMLAVVRAWVAANHPGCTFDYVDIHILYKSLPLHPISLVDDPAGTSASAETVTEDAESAGRPCRGEGDIALCAKEILQTMHEVGRPLTCTLLRQEMAKRRFNWDERTVKRYLSELMEDETIENPKGARPPGYRLTSSSPVEGGTR